MVGPARQRLDLHGAGALADPAKEARPTGSREGDTRVSQGRLVGSKVETEEREVRLGDQGVQDAGLAPGDDRLTAIEGKVVSGPVAWHHAQRDARRQLVASRRRLVMPGSE